MEKQAETRREQKQEAPQSKAREQNAPAKRESVPAEGRDARLLLTGNAVRELPPDCLRELASMLGNSGMLGLLKGGGEKPETYAFTRFGSGEGEDEPNRIRTGTPELCAPTGAGARDGPLTRAADPRGIRDRLTPGNMKLFGEL